MAAKREPANIKYIQNFPCLVCLKEPPSECHHYHAKGMGGGGRDDSLENLVPLCHTHHREFHQRGVEAWKKKYLEKVQARRKILGLPPIKI